MKANREIVLPDGSFLEMRPLKAIDHLIAKTLPKEHYEACLIAASVRIDGKPLSIVEVLDLPLEIYFIILRAIGEPLANIQHIIGGVK